MGIAIPTLVVGDHFIPASYYVAALTKLDVSLEGIRTVDWSGNKAAQHAAEHRMELGGPDAVPVPDEIVKAVKDAEVLAVHFAPVPAAVFEAASRLRAVVVARSGLENVDVDVAAARGVKVIPVHGRNSSAVAELALGLMLAEARDIARADASVKHGGWRKDFGGPGDEIGGSTVGLVGFGHVGRELARRLRGFDVRLLVADPYVDNETLAAHHAERTDLDSLFQRSDFVQVVARLTSETERLVTARHFELMKPTAYFVNTARSRLVDNDALFEALAGNKIAGAALDVFDAEPLPAESPWRSLDNVTFTTHFGGDTLTTNLRSARLVAEAICRLS